MCCESPRRPCRPQERKYRRWMAERRLQAETGEWETQSRHQPAKQQAEAVPRGKRGTQVVLAGGCPGHVQAPHRSPARHSQFAPKGLKRKKVGL